MAELAMHGVVKPFAILLPEGGAEHFNVADALIVHAIDAEHVTFKRPGGKPLPQLKVAAMGDLIAPPLAPAMGPVERAFRAGYEEGVGDAQWLGSNVEAAWAAFQKEQGNG